MFLKTVGAHHREGPVLSALTLRVKLDKIRNERIRGTTKVGEITKNVQERRLKWYGHVMRREEQYVGRRAMVMKVGREKEDRQTDRQTGNFIKIVQSMMFCNYNVTQ